MEHKNLKELHNQLSWNTKIYTLLAISVVVFAKLSDALQSDFALTIVLALLLVLFVESFVTISVKHPLVWRYVKWIVILLVLGFMLVGTDLV